MDPREAKFLASQAERRLTAAKQHQKSSYQTSCNDGGDSLPVLLDNDCVVANDKEQCNQFFTNFRRVCLQFHSQIDALLLIQPSNNNDTVVVVTAVVTSSSSATSTNQHNNCNNDEVKAYYATTARRNEGRTQLNNTLQNVRLLQHHALSSSSSINNHHHTTSENDNDNNTNNELLLRSILQTPMPEMTQTDIRLITQEIDNIIKCIDGAMDIICPKEKFTFRRYRKAMAAEREKRLGDKANNTTIIMLTENVLNANVTEKDEKKQQQQENNSNLRAKYGGVLENMTNCTIEISANGTVLVDNETTRKHLQYYSAPRSAHALHLPSHATNSQQQQHQEADTTQQQEQQDSESSSSSSSYLLQNLSNVTILLHGSSRPSVHIQHIHNCKIYISEPTCGPVHVTDCHSSTLRCSCYQLRIHDSKDVTFQCWVRSGPIIEDCTGMIFEGDYYHLEENDDDDDVNINNDNKGYGGYGSSSSSGVGRNMYWDVKDFNWLRALRKSPNFTVIPIKKSYAGLERSDEAAKKMSKNDDDDEKQAVIEPPTEEEEDSEDEL